MSVRVNQNPTVHLLGSTKRTQVFRLEFLYPAHLVQKLEQPSMQKPIVVLPALYEVYKPREGSLTVHQEERLLILTTVE